MRWRGSLGKSDRGALVAALLLHCTALLSVRIWAERASLRADRTEPPLPHRDVEIDISESPVPPDSSNERELRAHAVDAREQRASPRRVQPLARANSIAEAAPREAMASEAEASGPDAPELGEPETSDAPQAAIDLGIGPEAWKGWAAVAAKEAREPTDAPKARRRPLVRVPRPSRTGGLQERLEAQDRERGLGPSGRVISAFYQAAHAALAPQTGVAHFNVTVFQTGVVEVSLSGADANSQQWQAVGARAAEALRHTPPRIPASRAGVRLTLDLTAEETMPNGSKLQEHHGPRLELKKPEFRSVERQKAVLKDLNPVAGTNPTPGQDPPAIVELPGVYVTEKGKVCGYRLGLTPLGPVMQGGCDLSNVGVKPQRMVRTQVREETFF
jgi:hypothetical protein